MLASVAAVALATAGTSATYATAVSALPTVGCDQIIGPQASPTGDGYRSILGGYVSVPPGGLGAPIRIKDIPGWPWWLKAGIAVRAGRQSVIVSVPQAWRKRVAITWGNSGPGTVGVVSALRFAACPPASTPSWGGYAGGFYLRGRSACVPLIFEVGNQRAVVRFGIGQRCRQALGRARLA